MIAPSPSRSELVTLWHRLSPEAQASLLRIARAKAAAGGSGNVRVGP